MENPVLLPFSLISRVKNPVAGLLIRLAQKNVFGFHLDSLNIFFLLRPILVCALRLASPYFPNLPPLDISYFPAISYEL